MGLTRDLPDARSVSWASRLRVAHQEAQGNLRVRSRAAELRAASAASPWLARTVAWRGWFDSAFSLQLKEAKDHYAGRGVTPSNIEERCAPGAARPYDLKTTIKVRGSFQKVAREAAREEQAAKLEQRIRTKLQRWQLPLFPRVGVSWFLKMFSVLRPAVPPRVAAAMWRTAWNGWVTHRRMRAVTALPNTCIFACTAVAPDSIEHYATCPRVLDLGRRLGITTPNVHDRMANFLALDVADPAKHLEDLVRKAVRTAAVYRVHGLVRHGFVNRGAAAAEALAQSAREVTQGHARAQRATDH